VKRPARGGVSVEGDAARGWKIAYPPPYIVHTIATLVPATALIGLTLVAGCGAASLFARHEFDGEQAMKDVETQMAFGPRIPNTEGARRCGDWIIARLRATADSVDVQAFNHVTAERDTLHLRNIIGHFEPGRSDRVLYLAHWDTRPHADKDPDPAKRNLPMPGADDGASEVAVLLGIADALKRKPPAVGVDLPADAHPLFAVLFDMVGDKDLRIPQEGFSVQRAPEVVERVWAKAQELGYQRYFPATVTGPITDDHVPLLEVGVHAIDVIDLEYPYWHTAEDTADKLSVKSLQVVGDVAVALLR
jgi:glutaminyl-peptide cyclotransferase